MRAFSNFQNQFGIHVSFILWVSEHGQSITLFNWFLSFFHSFFSSAHSICVWRCRVRKWNFLIFIFFSRIWKCVTRQPIWLFFRWNNTRSMRNKSINITIYNKPIKIITASRNKTISAHLSLPLCVFVWWSHPNVKCFLHFSFSFSFFLVLVFPFSSRFGLSLFHLDPLHHWWRNDFIRFVLRTHILTTLNIQHSLEKWK